MDKRFFVFYALIAAVILWLVLPNSLFGLFAAMLIAVGCGVLESVQPLFRPASFAGTAMALVLLVGRTGVLPGVLGTVLVERTQSFTLEQSLGFGLGSGLGYAFIVFIVREGRRRLRSKAVPAIFQGLPSSMIYIGVLSLAIYALVGHSVVL